MSPHRRLETPAASTRSWLSSTAAVGSMAAVAAVVGSAVLWGVSRRRGRHEAQCDTDRGISLENQQQFELSQDQGESSPRPHGDGDELPNSGGSRKAPVYPFQAELELFERELNGVDVTSFAREHKIPFGVRRTARSGNRPSPSSGAVSGGASTPAATPLVAPRRDDPARWIHGMSVKWTQLQGVLVSQLTASIDVQPVWRRSFFEVAHRLARQRLWDAFVEVILRITDEECREKNYVYGRLVAKASPSDPGAHSSAQQLCLELDAPTHKGKVIATPFSGVPNADMEGPKDVTCMWTMIGARKGSTEGFMIASRLHHLVIDIPGSRTLITYHAHGKLNQRWSWTTDGKIQSLFPIRCSGPRSGPELAGIHYNAATGSIELRPLAECCSWEFVPVEDADRSLAAGSKESMVAHCVPSVVESCMLFFKQRTDNHKAKRKRNVFSPLSRLIDSEYVSVQ